jgi:hypothetical protein
VPSIQDVPSQTVVFRHVWVIEVASSVISHTDSFHDTARPCIDRRRKCNDLREARSIKTERWGRPSAFLSIALAPLIKRQSPSNLDTRVKGKRISGNV